MSQHTRSKTHGHSSPELLAHSQSQSRYNNLLPQLQLLLLALLLLQRLLIRLLAVLFVLVTAGSTLQHDHQLHRL